MSYLKKITTSNFFIRLKSWEYWPFGVIQFPAMLYWLWLSLRSRSLVFFSASNPGIPMGGMFGESKYDVLKKIPAQFIPETIRIEFPATFDEVNARICAAGMNLPVIFKPDLGERGFMVRKINCAAEIREYLVSVKCDFLVQEWISSPLEFGVFYMRFPEEENGKIVSVAGKEMLAVTGDGNASLRELIFRHPRARLQWRKLKGQIHDRLGTIPPKGEKIELVSIGNHCLGTTFLNGNHLINDRLATTFDRISRPISGFYFGRFDLRCNTLEDLYEGKVKILELNGCGAEPSHIYDPDFSMWQAMWVQVVHWDNIYRIAEANKRRGVKMASHREAYSFYRKFKAVVN